MSQPEQSFQKHAKYDPLFHFFLAPVSFGLLVWAVVRIFRYHTSESVLMAAALLVLFLLVFKVRIYSLKVQDRLIRLEERLRLGGLGGDALRSRIPQLTEKQLIAIRFASDDEAPALAAKALDTNMAPKDIKAAVKNWRADHFRV